jgi:tetratricopeptide (TPR) repeat protein
MGSKKTGKKHIPHCCLSYLVCLLLAGLSPGLLAQTAAGTPSALERENAPYWYKLERGKRLFRSGSYGEALTLFEEARNERRIFYEDRRSAVLALLSLPEVRAMEDSLDRIIAFAQERHYEAANAAFAELFFRIPREELYGAASASLDLFDRLKAYPEAEFWIGEVYRVEGSASIAVKQYERALSMTETLKGNLGDNLADSALETEMLFRLASFQKINGNYNEMERRLEQILERDTLWSEEPSSFVRNAMQRTLENEGVDRFLLMYRHQNSVTEKAHRLLAEYFYLSGRHLRAAEHYLFAWLIASTTVIEAYQSKLIDEFRFTTLSAVTSSLSRRPDITAYMNEVEYYKTAYYLGASLYGAGRENAARSVWNYLAGETNAGEWRVRAQRQLRSPEIEEPVPLP